MKECATLFGTIITEMVGDSLGGTKEVLRSHELLEHFEDLVDDDAKLEAANDEVLKTFFQGVESGAKGIFALGQAMFYGHGDVGVERSESQP